MEIGTPEIVRTGDDVEYRVAVQSSEGRDVLWYRVPARFGDLVCDSSEAALAGMLCLAMARGEDIRLTGPVSERLVYTFSGAYQCLQRNMMPWLGRIGIHAPRIGSPAPEGRGVGAGFSAGIDSYCVVGDHYYAEVPPEFRLTHLLFFNVGSHGDGERGDRLFEARYARVAEAAEEIGLPLVKVNSNLGAFYSRYGKVLNFDQTSTVRNVSAALVLQRGLQRYLMASAVSYPDIVPGVTHSAAYSDPIAMPLLATEGLDTLSVGSEYTRVEKTLRVAALPGSHLRLDVCTDPDRAGNCSKCWKCMRTMLTLEIAGLLSSYHGVFDVQAYLPRRERFLREVLSSDEPLYREIVEFARQRGYAFPLTSRLYARLLAVAQPPLQAARRLRAAWRRSGPGGRPGGPDRTG